MTFNYLLFFFLLLLKRQTIFKCFNFRGGSRGRVPGVPPPPEMTCGFLKQLVFCKKKTMWFIGVEVEQETSAPPPKKNPGSAPEFCYQCIVTDELVFLPQK